MPSRPMSVQSTWRIRRGREQFRVFPEGTHRSALPAVRRKPRRAIRLQAHVECRDQAIGAEPAEPVGHRGGRLDGDAPDDHAFRPVGEHAHHVGQAPDPAASLDTRAALGDELAQHRVVGGDAVACAVEVDDVHAANACGGEALNEPRRRRPGARFPREFALEQAHRAALAQVDGGHELH